MKKNLSFALYDVFSNKPFSGNQAAVIRSEGPFSPDKLLILAKEFNLPETCAYWMINGIPHMIFATSESAINACGHGLLAVLADVVIKDTLTTSEGLNYVIETCGLGLWKIIRIEQRSMYISVKWPRLPTSSKLLPVKETAQLLGINIESIRSDLQLAAFDSGITNGLIPLVDENVLTTLQPDFGKNMKRYFAKHKIEDLELYCITEEQIAESSQLDIRSRNIFWYGVQEENATGSSSLSLAAFLFEHFGGSALRIDVTQGLARQGNIIAKIIRDAMSTNAWLEGNVRLIASGSDLIIPP